MARQGTLYPAVILHGGKVDARQRAAVLLSRALLCDEESSLRPCGECTHCRRIGWNEQGSTAFHPDLHLLEQDLKTATSIDRARSLLHEAQLSPFEARGQVFVVANAESLIGGAADTLLKAMEEPYETAPRNFLLLAPSQFDLLPTLRSRSLSLYLGAGERPDSETLEQLTKPLKRCWEGYSNTGLAVYLMSLATALATLEDWRDPRAAKPWISIATAILRYRETLEVGVAGRSEMLLLAEDLLSAPRMRIRGVSPQRILEGMFFHRLAGLPRSG